MPGARPRHRARVEIEHRVGHRDEAAAVEVRRDDAVRRHEQVARRAVDLRQRQHQPLELRHVERGRRALAGHVRDEQAEAIALERQKIVVIAAHLARRLTHGRERHARELDRRVLRQQRHLDAPRDPQFLLEPLLLRHLGQQRRQVRGHAVEGVGQLAELVLRQHRDAVREVALPHALGADEQLVHRAGDRAGQRQSHQQRDELDDQEEHADEHDDRHEQLAEGQAAVPHARRQPRVDLAHVQHDRQRGRAGASGHPVGELEEDHPRRLQRAPGGRIGCGALRPVSAATVRASAAWRCRS